MTRNNNDPIEVGYDQIPGMDTHFAAFNLNVEIGDHATTHRVYGLHAGSKYGKSEFLDLPDIPDQSVNDSSS
jgi:hypothetical protein